MPTAGRLQLASHRASANRRPVSIRIGNRRRIAMTMQQPAQQQHQQAPPAAAAGQAPAGQAQDRPGKCHFFLETKRRFCKFDAVPGKQYCGNHLYLGEGTGPKRVPCPWDPKGGHTVLESELEKHKAKCPGYRQWLAERQQPFYCEDINAGSGPEAEFPADLQPLQPAPAATATAMATATATATAAAPAAREAAAPPAAGEGAAAEPAAPAAAEAAEAAAAAGAPRPTRKERRRAQRAAGSGGGAPPRGPAAMQAAYAASMGEARFTELLRRIEAACDQICEAEPLSVVVPPEAEPFLLPESATCNRPFSLKHAQQQASIVGNMQQRGLVGDDVAEVTYIEYGAGKGYLSHMLASCTPARKVVMMDVRGFKEKADRSMRHLEMQRLRCDIKDFDVAQVPGLEGGRAPWVAFGKHLCGAATDFTLRSCVREHQKQQQGQQDVQQQQQQGSAGAAPAGAAAAAAPGPSSGHAGGGVRGLAIATCCHHRCSWRHFVAQEVMAELGFSPQEFEVMAWMTGWALCGHEAPAGFGGDGCDGEQAELQLEGQQQQGEPQQEGQQQGQQQCEVAGAQAMELEGQTADAAAGPTAVGPTASGHKRGREEEESEAAAANGGTTTAAAAATTAGTANPSAAPAEQQAGQPAASQEWRPQWALPREQRIAVGQRCKRLIDAARLRWLRRQGFEAGLVKYVASTVSGENRLLLATTAAGAASATGAAAVPAQQ